MRSQTVGAFLADEYPRLVEPVIAELLAADELDVVDIAVVDWNGRTLAADAPITEALLRFRDADGSSMAVVFDGGGPGESDAEFAGRLRSDLQDFIAESTFGWGQLRG
ncbi:hypothetical protein [Curtobacterium sp. Leaf261]|uniref:hypothetical protein n=1 Tax=Curtobacterium sp. Leaf261 TaxID=1736311 RepID=UPI0006FF724A|nr:hypothetical protein [Curtobacterium sp. Leaf261]KQO62769.1 hypothetical protein ASF23_07405 [Curtobacterium sp. Leaf261]